MRGWNNIFHANGKQKKGGVAILISDEKDLKIKKITRDKEGHYIMIKVSIQKEDITIVNNYAPNISQFSQFSCSVLSESLRPHESQHARPPCPSPTPGVHPNSCASSR